MIKKQDKDKIKHQHHRKTLTGLLRFLGLDDVHVVLGVSFTFPLVLIQRAMDLLGDRV